MEPIDFMIKLAIFIILFYCVNTLLSFYFACYEAPTTNQDSGFTTQEIEKSFVKGTLDQIASFLLPILKPILIFFTIMYIIYLIIITLIPETGPMTIFIPIRELLLKIYPLPVLMDRGIFRLYDNILEIFSLKQSILRMIIKFFSALMQFSKDNIKEALIFMFPNFEDKINIYIDNIEDDNSNNKDNSNKDKPKLVNLEEGDVYKKIEEDKQACITQNTIPITPNMSASEKMEINMKNNFEKVNCESKSISNYIRSNN